MLKLDNKKKIVSIFLSLALIFVGVYLITNFSGITGLLKNILSIFAPVIVGAIMAYILNPILRLYERKVFAKMKSKGKRRVLSITLTYVSALLLILGFVFLIVPQLIQSISSLVGKFDTYYNSLINLINSFIERFDLSISKENVSNFIKGIFENSETGFNKLLAQLGNFGQGLFIGVKNTFIGIFISIYILAAKERLSAQIRKFSTAFMKDGTKNHMFRYTRIINRTFGQYFVGQIVDACIVGIVTLIFLLIFRVPYALLVSTIVGITNIIPIFGPFIGAIPSAFIIFIASPKKALVFIILILVIQQIDGNVIAPRVLGNSTGVSSLGVIVAIVVMGECFGLLGMIIGVPMFAVVTIIITEIIDMRLKEKGLPTGTENYYPAHSSVDPNEHREKISERIFKALFGSINFKKIFSKKKTKIKSGAKGENASPADTDSSGTEPDNDITDITDSETPEEPDKKDDENSND